MKRIVLVFGLIFCVVSMGFSADVTDQEDLEIYTYLYESTNSPAEKFNILLVLQSRQISGAGEFYARAFNSLVNQSANIQRTASATDRIAADDLAQTLAALLGDEKYASSAGDLWRAYNAFSAPLVKAETLISLGKLRAVEFLPQVVRVLQDNATPPSGREEVDARSHIVRGAILALEKYGDVSGYLPVFIISISGYPERIRKLARDTLPVLLEDPSELLTEQLINSSSYAPPVKLVALEAIDAANVPNTAKAAAAAAAFAQGWGSPTNDFRQKVAVTDLRKTSIGMIGRYGAADPAVYPLIERSYRDMTDADEKIACIRALGTLASEDSAKLLSSFALNILGKQNDGSSDWTDDKLIRELIPALAANRQPLAAAALQTIAERADTPAVKTLARNALQ
jgi:hypothetical protein